MWMSIYGDLGSEDSAFIVPNNEGFIVEATNKNSSSDDNSFARLSTLSEELLNKGMKFIHKNLSLLSHYR